MKTPKTIEEFLRKWFPANDADNDIDANVTVNDDVVLLTLWSAPEEPKTFVVKGNTVKPNQGDEK